MTECPQHIKLEAVIEAICAHGALMPEDVNESTRIAEDLIIMGDDAIEMFMYLEEEFGADFSELHISEYFPSECSANMLYQHIKFTSSSRTSKILNFPFLLFWSIFAKKKHYKTMNVGQIFKAIKTGCWQDYS